MPVYSVVPVADVFFMWDWGLQWAGVERPSLGQSMTWCSMAWPHTVFSTSLSLEVNMSEPEHLTCSEHVYDQLIDWFDHLAGLLISQQCVRAKGVTKVNQALHDDRGIIQCDKVNKNKTLLKGKDSLLCCFGTYFSLMLMENKTSIQIEAWSLACVILWDVFCRWIRLVHKAVTAYSRLSERVSLLLDHFRVRRRRPSQGDHPLIAGSLYTEEQACH